MGLLKGYASTGQSSDYRVEHSYLTKQRDQAEMAARQMLLGEITMEQYRKAVSRTETSPDYDKLPNKNK